MNPPVEVIPSPWFARRIKKLRKRYPHYTKSDQNDISLEEIEAIIADLPNNDKE